MNGDIKERFADFLEAYRSLPELWDPNCQYYKNHAVRRKGYEKLLTVYRAIDNNATEEHMKKKISNIRTAYRREVNKVKISNARASSPEEVYTPALWYYELLSFLEDVNESTNSIDPLEETYTQLLEDLPEPKKRCGIEKKGKFRICKKEYDPLNQSYYESKNQSHQYESTNQSHQYEPLNQSHSLQTTKDDEWEIMGKSIGYQLRDLDKSQLTIVNKLISDAIFYAKIGKLTNNSSISFSE